MDKPKRPRPPTPPEIDWNLCAICQEEKAGEKPHCPANAKQRSQDSAYVTLAENLMKSHELGALITTWSSEQA